MKHQVEMGEEREFAAREKGYTFALYHEAVGAEYFDEVTTVIHGGTFPLNSLTGSTEEEQFR